MESRQTQTLFVQPFVEVYTLFIPICHRLNYFEEVFTYFMCDRFSFTLSKEKTTRRFSVKVTEPIPLQYNISPGHTVAIVTQTQPRKLVWASWGIQTSRQTPVHRIFIQTGTSKLSAQTKELLGQRCLILADGFYVWKKVSQRSRVPHRVILKWNVPFAIAGVYTIDPDTNAIHCALLTTTANIVLEPFVKQMPVIVPLEKEKNWLGALPDEGFRDFIEPYAVEQMRIFPISNQINDKEANTLELTQPTQPADQFGNYVLFE